MPACTARFERATLRGPLPAVHHAILASAVDEHGGLWTIENKGYLELTVWSPGLQLVLSVHDLDQWLPKMVAADVLLSPMTGTWPMAVRKGRGFFSYGDGIAEIDQRGSRYWPMPSAVGNLAVNPFGLLRVAVGCQTGCRVIETGRDAVQTLAEGMDSPVVGWASNGFLIVASGSVVRAYRCTGSAWREWAEAVAGGGPVVGWLCVETPAEVAGAGESGIVTVYTVSA